MAETNPLRYKRILLKLSGESLMGDKSYGIDEARLDQYAEEIIAVASAGAEVAVVIGGGNIYRGMQAVALGIDGVQGDHMGML
ncbi:MAG: UMP kinase, partial [Flavobacteriales bacterium]|nr:UMP kinase [Flavobacteriales bacterium]